MAVKSPPWQDIPALRAAVEVIEQTPDLNASIRAMVEREDELLAGTLGSNGARQYAAVLAGIASNPRSRALFELAIDASALADTALLREEFTRSPYVREVIIGSGLHAAIYASTKVAAGGSKPLVIERRSRPGGTFAVARRPVFNLNSRNRRESLSLPRRPGTPGPLNSEVGAILQPSDIGYQEYQTQADQAFVTRVNLAMNARMLMDTEVMGVEHNNDGAGRYLIRIGGPLPYTLKTDRIIVAAGIGAPRISLNLRGESDRILTFDEFIERMGDTSNRFPLRGFRRVAVVGANDSGRVVVEYLLGQAGDQGLSVAGLDFVENITWVGQKALTKEGFEQQNRSRYKGIGRYMPRADQPGYYYRVQPQPGRGIAATPIRDGVRLTYRTGRSKQVSERFDYVILATGFVDQTDALFETLDPLEVNALSGDRIVGKRFMGEEIYKVGPVANLTVSDVEREETAVFDQISDNSVALFRYSGLTASLAGLLTMESLGDKFGALRDKVEKRTQALADPTPKLGSGSFTVPRVVGEPLPDGVTSEDALRYKVQTYFGDLEFPPSYNSPMRIRVETDRADLKADVRRGGTRDPGTLPREVWGRSYLLLQDPVIQTLLGRLSGTIDITITSLGGVPYLPGVTIGEFS